MGKENYTTTFVSTSNSEEFHIIHNWGVVVVEM
jgi:hypothetical protein